MNVLEKEYVKDIEQVCREKDILLIVDEVQTGIGRTGTFLCCEQYGIHPNVVTLAKRLGAGEVAKKCVESGLNILRECLSDTLL